MRQFILKVVTLIGVSAIAGPYSFGASVTQIYSGAFPATISGTLQSQGTALLEQFTLPSSGNLTITTSSYASGGFEPDLLLFNSLNKFVTAGTPFGSIDPKTGIIGDTRLTATNLPAGMYTLALSDFLLNQSTTATSLADSFTMNYGSGSTFVDSGGNQRNNTFSLTITPGASAVPEPATFWLLSPLLAAITLWSRKRCSEQTVVVEFSSQEL